MEKIKKQKLSEILNSPEDVSKLFKAKNLEQFKAYLFSKGIELNENDMKEIDTAAKEVEEFKKSKNLNDEELSEIAGGFKIPEWVKETGDIGKNYGDIQKFAAATFGMLAKRAGEKDTVVTTSFQGLAALASTISAVGDITNFVNSLSSTSEKGWNLK